MTKNESSGFLSNPLLQFLAIGLVVYAIVSWQMPAAQVVNSPSADDLTIRVERDDLLAYVQLRSGEADAEALERSFGDLSAASKRAWIDRYVREEALVREARRLGLDRDDDLIRRRLVQQMEFIAVDAGRTAAPISAGEIAAYYRDHREDFREPAYYTFDHIFFRADADGTARAEDALGRIVREEIASDQIFSLGDRFPYNRRYAERTDGEVRSHFGNDFAHALAGLERTAGWVGPIESDHGSHLVLLSKRTTSEIRSLEEVTPDIRRELARAREEAGLDSGVDQILSRYVVEIVSPTTAED